MKLQLYSIDHAPLSLPIWHAIMADLSDPPVQRVARVLGVSTRTVYRYNATGQAPRAVLLALFWLTRWGRSSVHAQATNDAVLAVQFARSLSDRLRTLESDLERLQLLGDFGAANEPLLRGPHGG